jgi:uncharacterized protein YcbK (DUF882 family)
VESVRWTESQEKSFKSFGAFLDKLTSAPLFVAKNRTTKFGGAKNSFHVLGKAFDIKTSKMSTQEKEDLVTKVISLGFRGIGVYDKHIHIDDREKEARWVGKSS